MRGVHGWLVRLQDSTEAALIKSYNESALTLYSLQRALPGALAIQLLPTPTVPALRPLKDYIPKP